MKSIRRKITVCLMATVLIALAAVGASSIILNYRNTVATVDRMMSETAELAAERIEQELTAYRNVAMDTGCIPQLSEWSATTETKQAILNERVRMHNFQRGNIIGADGVSIFDGKDYSDREYVQQAMGGAVYVSEPLVSKITGELSIIVAAPIYSGGTQGGRIVGVVYFVPPETFLNDIVSSIKVSPNSRAYMINRSGDTIADVTLDTITTQNVERESQSDASLRDLAAIHADMRQGGPLVRRLRPCGGHRRLERSRHRHEEGLSGGYIFRHVYQRAGGGSLHHGLHRGGPEALQQHQRPHAGLRPADEAAGGGRSGLPRAPGHRPG